MMTDTADIDHCSISIKDDKCYHQPTILKHDYCLRLQPDARSTAFANNGSLYMSLSTIRPRPPEPPPVSSPPQLPPDRLVPLIDCSSLDDRSESFIDNGFIVYPFSDRLPLHDGTYESEDSRSHRLKYNIQQKMCQCACLGDGVTPDEDLEGPYYTHLIAAPSSSAIGRIVQLRLRLDASAVRIEKIVYTGKEGRSQLGCPIAKWIYRRSGPQEKVLCLVRDRTATSMRDGVDLCRRLCLGRSRSATRRSTIFAFDAHFANDWHCI